MTGTWSKCNNVYVMPEWPWTRTNVSSQWTKSSSWNTSQTAQASLPTPKKTATVIKTSAPENSKKPRSFEGMVYYLAKFLPMIEQKTKADKGFTTQQCKLVPGWTTSDCLSKKSRATCVRFQSSLTTTLKHTSPFLETHHCTELGSHCSGKTAKAKKLPVANASRALTQAEQNILGRVSACFTANDVEMR